ncbi:MAG: phosphotransferase [Actinomycetota bacterium]|nr:phosphotransferase [Actinomycetota bacterium]
MTTTIEDLLPAYLGRQRWFSGEEPARVEVEVSDWLVERLRWLVVDADGVRYQLVVGLQPADNPPDFLHGHDDEVLGAVDGSVAFDAVLDPELARALLSRVSPGEEARHVRPLAAEQSNSSLVFDDRLFLKLFRRLHPGPNPDVEVTTALAAAGFAHVAEPLGVWRHGDMDLAVCERYLAGGAEGWALALTSLRDLYASGCAEPADAGGDFFAEARRLGQVTAAMHLALAGAFGAQPGDAAAWSDLVEAQLARLRPDDADAAAAKAFAERLRSVADPGASVRVHGDYHLGQVMRTDTGWFVLDFEGEPARPLAERRRPSSPYKDVAGMLRSFHYAAHVALAERDEVERATLGPAAEAWEARNGGAFLGGYLATDGIDDILPGNEEDRQALLAAFELDKAVYEVLYERAHRPDWLDIPRAAIRRLLRG